MISSKKYLYDIFLHKAQPGWMRQILLKSNQNIIDFLLKLLPQKSLSILEIGPGKGYFYDALKTKIMSFSYSALDKNINILKQLKIPTIYQSDLPDLPVMKNKYDLIYLAYVVEHLKNGTEYFHLIKNCRKNLKLDGLIVLLMPNATLNGMEFWDMDYTHMFPPTKRGIYMGFADNGFTNIDVYEYNDLALWLTGNPIFWPWILRFCRILFFWYDYRFFSVFFSFIYKVPDYYLTNIFFRFYIFVKSAGIFAAAKL